MVIQFRSLYALPVSVLCLGDMYVNVISERMATWPHGCMVAWWGCGGWWCVCVGGVLGTGCWLMLVDNGSCQLVLCSEWLGQRLYVQTGGSGGGSGGGFGVGDNATRHPHLIESPTCRHGLIELSYAAHFFWSILVTVLTNMPWALVLPTRYCHSGSRWYTLNVVCVGCGAGIWCFCWYCHHVSGTYEWY